VPVFPTDVLRHFMYSLPNPSESGRPFSPLEDPVLRALGRRGGGAQNGTDSYALRKGLHAIGRGGHRIQKARYHWLWAVGAGVVGTVGGGMGTGNEREGGGVYLPQTCADIYHTGVFQKYVFCS
jgi:hypothetical protein